jgi:hypothetical protein
MFWAGLVVGLAVGLVSVVVTIVLIGSDPWQQ